MIDVAPGLRFEAAPTYGRVPTAAPLMTAGEIRDRLVGERFESAAHIAVVDDDRLVGLARLEDVLVAPSTVAVGELIDRDPPVILAGVDEEVAAWKAVRHGESAVAIVDNGSFVGLVPPRRIVEVLVAEHDEDLARLGGYLASTSSARHATEESVRSASATGCRGCSSGYSGRSPRRSYSTPSAVSSSHRPVRRLFHGHRRGDDAAVAAPSPRSRSRLRGGPLATVIQDLLSLVIYLVVASFVVG